ncbi:major head protein [Gordonia phage Daredevil]|uniref:Major capsid protein n=1 Tax=Gordonia phage Daredevil TaxID=2283286 RepID=A0A345MIM4_9CAUD|nr:major head protein [Gordonia phage Daredevil]AXH70405.1 major capsid protein [Gordonia phage Daredevil]
MADNILYSPVHPDAATSFVRKIPTPADHLLAKYLPTKEIVGTRVEVTEAVLISRTAKFRAFDAQPTKLERDGYSKRQLGLLPVTVEGGYGELERLKIDQMRLAGTSDQPIVEAIYDDLTNGVEAIRNRIELARGQLLSTGQVEINENGIVGAVADFNVPTSNFPDAAVAWSDVENATPVEDLTAWVLDYKKKNGFAPAGMVVSRQVLSYLQRNKEIRVHANLQANGGPQLVGLDVVSAVLSNFMLPPIVDVYDTILNVDGVDQRVLPENQLVFVTPVAKTLGETVFGAPSASRALAASSAVELSMESAPGLVGMVIQEPDFPFQEKVIVDGIVLPVLNSPKALYSPTVY